MTAWTALFWTSGILIFLAYPGYPLLLRLIHRKAATAPDPDGGAITVSVVLVVRNEADRIKERLLNLLETMAELQSLIVVCDGCTDATAAMARGIANPAVKIIELESPQGKPMGVNTGIQAAASEVVILCDARQRFEAETIPRLVRWFSDPKNGAVSGALEIEPAASAGGSGVDAYWRLEKYIRRLESDLDSTVGCTGAVYAVRKSAFTPLPPDTILDDVVVPMQIAAKGYRVRFDATALAFDPQKLDGALELRRKIRTLAGNFQMMARYPSWMLPWSQRLWWKLIMHKYLRLAGPVLLLILGCSALMTLSVTISWITAAALALVLALGGLGLALPGQKSKVLAWPAGFLFLQWCVLRGFAQWLLGSKKGGWR